MKKPLFDAIRVKLAALSCSLLDLTLQQPQPTFAKHAG